jgi:DNA invertase Pin-like site-specific DNA recombinase
MAKVGYKRVSTQDQSLDRQLHGEILDKTFEDKVSGRSTKRPALEDMLSYVREGDEVVVHSMDRLARNLKDLMGLVEDLNSKGISIIFKKENLSFSHDNSNPMAKLQLQMMGAFAEFERNLILERQREGIEVAKSKGVYKGRKNSLNDEQIKELKNRCSNGEKKSVVARDYKISRETIYRYLRSE